MEQESIGQRVRAAIDRVFGDRAHRSIATEVGMAPDAFSRSLNGSRAFSSLELARLADLLKEDVHWLITGEPDPLRVVFAARHDFDQESGQHHLPGREDDEAVLESVTLAYRQAQPWIDRGEGNLADTAADVRSALGLNFVASFADRIEECLDVDVVRVQGLSTDYSFAVAGRRVILLRSEPNWFRSNWSLAHELAHLALGHHDVTDTASGSAREQQANAFAGDLLLPADEMRAVNWLEIDAAQLARKVWDYGVSTQALKTRLAWLGLPVSSNVTAWLSEVTQRLLRAHPDATNAPVSVVGPLHHVVFATVDQITSRMTQSAERRFPQPLVRAHLDGIANGNLSKATLAWMLEVVPEELDVDEPEPQPAADAPVDDFISAMGLSTTGV